MSQSEQSFRDLLGKKPEIEKCYELGLVNRRSLARYLIQEKIAESSQFEAIIAMLRRYKFEKQKDSVALALFKDVKINIKDNVLILDFEKEKELLKKLQEAIAIINYDKGDTLKIAVGSESIKLIIDEENEKIIQKALSKFKVRQRVKTAEVNLHFKPEVMKAKGTLSIITRELTLNDIAIIELLTNTPELLIYVKEEDVLKTYEVIKRLKV